MTRIYLTFILVAILSSLFFSEIYFIFEPKTFTFFEKEIEITSQILLSGLAVLILVSLLLIGLIEKLFYLEKTKSKSEKKRGMATKE